MGVYKNNNGHLKLAQSLYVQDYDGYENKKNNHIKRCFNSGFLAL
jgi:hypothetical protein